VTSQYTDVAPGMCATEFAAFKACVQTAVRRRTLEHSLIAQIGRKW